jgi:uncharacterized membrane protein
MQEQNFKNHARYDPIFHIVLLGIILALTIMSIVNLVSVFNQGSGLLQGVMLFLIAIALIISFLKIRSFPLIAQDRAIRAEENLRYFTITGKLLDARLTLSQIIALRFAPDNELIELADRAVKEKLTNSDIKKAIKDWKADHHRA